MKIALVHDWLLSPVGGAENTLREMYELFPSPIYTLLWDAGAFSRTSLARAEVFSSFIERLPWGRKKFRSYLPLFPLAFEQFDLRQYDVILSSSHCAAKGILSHPDQLHICYCYTPMRYAWDLSYEYLEESRLNKGLKGALAKWFLHSLRGWDVHSSHRVDHFIAISQFIARRIRRCYGREATVIYPPVDTNFFQLGEKKESFYLTASRLVGYKRVDLIVEAFSRMPSKTLVVVGDGPEMEKIRKIAGKNIELLGYRSNEELRTLVQRARAFLFAAVEDFGIAPVEAMAAGTPVIALRRGGASETIVDGMTGLFFEEQNVASIVDAVERFERIQDWDPHAARARSLLFGTEVFRAKYRAFVDEKTSEFVNLLHK